jgi:hypothetical protein
VGEFILSIIPWAPPKSYQLVYRKVFTWPYIGKIGPNRHTAQAIALNGGSANSTNKKPAHALHQSVGIINMLKLDMKPVLEGVRLLTEPMKQKQFLWSLSRTGRGSRAEIAPPG